MTRVKGDVSELRIKMQFKGNMIYSDAQGEQHQTKEECMMGSASGKEEYREGDGGGLNEIEAHYSMMRSVEGKSGVPIAVEKY